jgi:hypothetical protein
VEIPLQVMRVEMSMLITVCSTLQTLPKRNAREGAVVDEQEKVWFLIAPHFVLQIPCCYRSLT